jgi:hypothetical protein
MRSSIGNVQTSTTSLSSYQPASASTSQANEANGKHHGSDPFSDVELGHVGNRSYRKENESRSYTDDPYDGRRSDEVEEYEMEQQQVSRFA